MLQNECATAEPRTESIYWAVTVRSIQPLLPELQVELVHSRHRLVWRIYMWPVCTRPPPTLHGPTWTVHKKLAKRAVGRLSAEVYGYWRELKDLRRNTWIQIGKEELLHNVQAPVHAMVPLDAHRPHGRHALRQAQAGKVVGRVLPANPKHIRK